MSERRFRKEFMNEVYPFSSQDEYYRAAGRSACSIVRGRPIELDFMGWRSDTYRLQQAGWEIAESRTHGGDPKEWRISMRHPQLGVSGMSVTPVRLHRSMYDERSGRPCSVEVELGLPYMVVQMDPTEFVAVDATPRYEEVLRPSDMYYMPYFHPIEDTKDIFLAKASVEEIMQIALDKQAPEQAEIRARRRQQQKRDGYEAEGSVEARLILVD